MDFRESIVSIEIFGTNQDKSLCREITKALPEGSCINYAGQTALIELMDHFRHLDVLACNDSGAMHLANAIGVPVVAIFGPTDPAVTGPIFDSPVHKIQSASGESMESIEAKIVVQAALKLLK